MSPDIIEKDVGTKKRPHWKAYICPIGNRHDKISYTLIKTLNNENI